MESVMSDYSETGKHGSIRGEIDGVKYLTSPDLSVTITDTEITAAMRLLLDMYRGRFDDWLNYDEPEKYGSMAAALTRARGETMEAGLKLSFENPYYQMLISRCSQGMEIAMTIAKKVEESRGN